MQIQHAVGTKINMETNGTEEGGAGICLNTCRYVISSKFICLGEGYMLVMVYVCNKSTIFRISLSLYQMGFRDETQVFRLSKLLNPLNHTVSPLTSDPN